LRVRRLERHGSEVDSVIAGDRASLNLVGLNRDDFKRGMIISDRELNDTTMIDAQLTLFHHAPKISIWSDVLFLLGTFEAQARAHLLDSNSAAGGDSALVQIHLPVSCNISIGDRFIIRSTSSDVTMGGGEVIDASPLHHRRRPSKLITNLEKIAEGKLTELIAAEVRKTKNVLLHTEIAEKLFNTPAEVKAVIQEGMPDDIVVRSTDETAYLITKNVYEQFLETILKNITAYHKRNPLDAGGRTIQDLIGVLGIGASERSEDFIRLLLDKLMHEGKLKQVGSTWAAVEHTVVIASDMQENIEKIDNYLKNFGMKVPLATEIDAFAKKNRIESKSLNQILRYLTEKKRLYRMEGDTLHADIVNPVRI
ncbi:unnamed protein product, partial [marine sediment metagenome]